MYIFPKCLKCRNLRERLSCKAFPERIPDKILEGKNKHSKPLSDQRNDIVFEAIPEVK